MLIFRPLYVGHYVSGSSANIRGITAEAKKSTDGPYLENVQLGGNREMAISIACGNCARKIRVKDKLAGKRVKCPQCSQPLTIPQPSNAEEELDFSSLAKMERQAPPAASRRHGNTRRPNEQERFQHSVFDRFDFSTCMTILGLIIGAVVTFYGVVCLLLLIGMYFLDRLGLLERGDIPVDVARFVLVSGPVACVFGILLLKLTEKYA